MFHRRYYDRDENLSMSMLAKGGITFSAIRLTPEAMKWGVAKCHENDNYDKRIGIVKSNGVANSKKGLMTPVMEFKEAKVFVAQLFLTLVHKKKSVLDNNDIKMAYEAMKSKVGS